MTKIDLFIEKSKKHLEKFCCCVDEDAELHEQAIEQIEALRKERDEYREALEELSNVKCLCGLSSISKEVLAKYPNTGEKA